MREQTIKIAEGEVSGCLEEGYILLPDGRNVPISELWKYVKITVG